MGLIDAYVHLYSHAYASAIEGDVARTSWRRQGGK